MTRLIIRLFPNLRDQFAITSSPTKIYNCVAWAAGETHRWWWPVDDPRYYWPQEVSRAETVECFVLAFETIGYSVCENEHFENNFEKVAIYADRYQFPTHMARQIASGLWTSKLGALEDIEHHSLNGLSGTEYGSVVQLMRRATDPNP